MDTALLFDLPRLFAHEASHAKEPEATYLLDTADELAELARERERAERMDEAA